MSFLKDLSKKIGITGAEEELIGDTQAAFESERPAVRSAVYPKDYQKPNPPTGNVASFSPGLGGTASTGTGLKDNVASYKVNVVVIEPETFNDAQQIAGNLQKKKPVVINFEKTETETAKRIIDFISGTMYALNGEIKKIGHNVFLCAPNNVNVSYNEDGKTMAVDMSWLKRQ